jgi:hypothetical protein
MVRHALLGAKYGLYCAQYLSMLSAHISVSMELCVYPVIPRAVLCASTVLPPLYFAIARNDSVLPARASAVVKCICDPSTCQSIHAGIEEVEWLSGEVAHHDIGREELVESVLVTIVSRYSIFQWSQHIPNQYLPSGRPP